MKSVNISLLKKINNTFLEILFPKECLGCESPGAFICSDCLRFCIKEPLLTCPICQRGSPVGSTHPKCQSPWSIDGIFAAGDFSDPILQKAIKILKYKNGKTLAQTLSDFLFLKLKDNFTDLIKNTDYILTYIPLFTKQEKRRDYNQSRLLALNLSLKVPWQPETLLIRTRETKDQTKLSKTERLKNMDNAFAIINKDKIKNKTIFVMDDVTTTGATLKEAALKLKRNGAAQVWGLAIAKETLQQP